MKQWLPIETEKEYKEATNRFEEIHDVGKDSPHFKEMLLLAILINDYEKKHFGLPEIVLVLSFLTVWVTCCGLITKEV